MALSASCYHDTHHLCSGPQHCDCDCHKAIAQDQEDQEAVKIMQETIESRRSLLQEAVRMLESATGTYDGKAQVMFRGRWYEATQAAEVFSADVAKTDRSL